MAEFILISVGVLMVTFAVMRLAACRYARLTKDLIKHGIEDLWP